MHLFAKNIFISTLLFLNYLTLVKCDMLESERASFLGFTREVAFSSTTLELVEQLTMAVAEQARGDRRVRRYFDAYDTPFIGSNRRKIEWF